ncbi:MAG: hypothetical protein ACRCYB_13470 [Aeromonas veronii]
MNNKKRTPESTTIRIPVAIKQQVEKLAEQYRQKWSAERQQSA